MRKQSRSKSIEINKLRRKEAMTTTNTRDKSVPATNKTSAFISNSGINVKVTYLDAVSEAVR